jgi:hypothetical protein
MNSCELQAAIVTSDANVMHAIALSLKKIGTASTVYHDKQSALQAMHRTKVDALFVDREIDPELSLLNEMRAASGNRRALGFAIIPREQAPGGAFRVADFLMDKPLMPQRLERALRAGHGLMLRERTRYFRKSIRIPVTLSDSSARIIAATTINISQGGLALESPTRLAPGQVHAVEFRLPGTETALNFCGRVIWSDDHGQAGLCLSDMNASHRQQLLEWIHKEFNAAAA